MALSVGLPSRIAFDDRISFDLNEPIGIDEANYLDKCAGRADVTEELPVDLSDLMPVIDSGEVDPGANDVRQRGPRFFKGSPDDFDASAGLLSRVARGGGHAVRPDGCGSRNRDQGAGPDRSGDPDARLIGASTRNKLVLHGSPSRKSVTMQPDSSDAGWPAAPRGSPPILARDSGAGRPAQGSSRQVTFDELLGGPTSDDSLAAGVPDRRTARC